MSGHWEEEEGEGFIVDNYVKNYGLVIQDGARLQLSPVIDWQLVQRHVPTHLCSV